jgi:hypothetical protein
MLVNNIQFRFTFCCRFWIMCKRGSLHNPPSSHLHSLIQQVVQYGKKRYHLVGICWQSFKHKTSLCTRKWRAQVIYASIMGHAFQSGSLLNVIMKDQLPLPSIFLHSVIETLHTARLCKIGFQRFVRRRIVLLLQFSAEPLFLTSAARPSDTGGSKHFGPKSDLSH